MLIPCFYARSGNSGNRSGGGSPSPLVFRYIPVSRFSEDRPAENGRLQTIVVCPLHESSANEADNHMGITPGDVAPTTKRRSPPQPSYYDIVWDFRSEMSTHFALVDLYW